MGTFLAADRDAEFLHQKITGTKASKQDMSSAEKIKVVDGNGDGVLTAD